MINKKITYLPSSREYVEIDYVFVYSLSHLAAPKQRDPSVRHCIDGNDNNIKTRQICQKCADTSHTKKSQIFLDRNTRGTYT